MGTRSVFRIATSATAAVALVASLGLPAQAAVVPVDQAPIVDLTAADVGTVNGLAVGPADTIFVLDNSTGVMEFAANANGLSTPIRTITGTFSTSTGLAVGPDGKIYVANSGGYRVFAADASGAATPEKSVTVNGASEGSGAVVIAVDPTNTTVVLGEQSSNGDRVQKVPVSADGTVTATTTLTYLSSGALYGVGIDVHGNVYASQYVNPQIVVWSSGATGADAPTRTIVGSNTALVNPTGMVVNSAGAILIADAGVTNGAVDSFPAGANGDVEPLEQIAGPSTQLSSPFTIAKNSAGVAFVASSSHVYGYQTVTVDPPSTPGKPTAVADGTAAVITVTPPVDGAAPTSYTVTASNGKTCTVTPPATSCRISGLAPGSTYTFTVTASNAHGTSASSPVSDPLTIPNSAPVYKKPVTIVQAGPVKGSGMHKHVNLSGTTKKKKTTVYVYRASTRHGIARLVAVTSSAKHAWKKKAVSLGGKSSAYFCARVGTSLSKTIRVPKASARSLADLRGDVFRCP